MERLILPILLIVAGTYFVVRNIRLLRDDQKFRAFLEHDRRSKLWVNRYGFDGALRLARRRFLPLGIAAGSVMVAVGLWSLLRSL